MYFLSSVSLDALVCLLASFWIPRVSIERRKSRFSVKGGAAPLLLQLLKKKTGTGKKAGSLEQTG